MTAKKRGGGAEEEDPTLFESVDALVQMIKASIVPESQLRQSIEKLLAQKDKTGEQPSNEGARAWQDLGPKSRAVERGQQLASGGMACATTTETAPAKAQSKPY